MRRSSDVADVAFAALRWHLSPRRLAFVWRAHRTWRQAARTTYREASIWAWQ